MILSGACSLQLTTTKTSIIDYNIEYVDYLPGSSFTPNCTFGQLNIAGTTTILSSSNANFLRKVKGFSIINSDLSESQNITLTKQVGGTEYKILNSVPLKSLESIYCDQNDNITTLDKFGLSKINKELNSSVSSSNYQIRKVFPIQDFANSGSAYFDASGYPGSWRPGTPGISGRNCYGSSVYDTGSLGIPTNGSQYISAFSAISAIANYYEIIDAIWVNTGISVTTTTLQTISSSQFPPRDLNGSSNGNGYKIGLYVTTATTNANGITNTVVQYTNELGTPNRWASVSSSNSLSFIPASSLGGTFIPFNLQQGDSGVRSIEGIYLNTSLGGGAVSLMVYKPLISAQCSLASTLSTTKVEPPGIKLWGDEALLIWSPIVTATAISTVYANLIVNTYV